MASEETKEQTTCTSPSVAVPKTSDLLTLDQVASTKDIFISISGLIGAGKTTLATKLAEKMSLPCFYEPVIDNAYLSDFYKDPQRYSFPLQVYLLNRRFQQHQQIIWQGQGGIQDRTIYEDSLFAKVLKDDGLMQDREYQTYRSLFSNMSNFIITQRHPYRLVSLTDTTSKKPNLIIHLDVQPEESKRRIETRNRDCESGITLDYLQRLYSAYESFIKDISRIIPVIRVNYNEYRSADEMVDMILREYAQMANVRSVCFDS
eukprot:TRINITY_DN1818_c0_g1_i2.p1 TRINITY_DN1818_c0_g1~~TRINITY_DN1818_c0_g1_i2.p1  ORF type:complete len:271 (-),score=43.74 TRINITY_DN1818_c0_g1_i2:105-887(-)